MAKIQEERLAADWIRKWSLGACQSNGPQIPGGSRAFEEAQRDSENLGKRQNRWGTDS